MIDILLFDFKSYNFDYRTLNFILNYSHVLEYLCCFLRVERKNRYITEKPVFSFICVTTDVEEKEALRNNKPVFSFICVTIDVEERKYYIRRTCFRIFCVTVIVGEKRCYVRRICFLAFASLDRESGKSIVILTKIK
jgi:hypothetical protein